MKSAIVRSQKSLKRYVYSEIGDWVIAGEPVGVLGDRERQGAVLYIEVRHEGEPVSPRQWLELLDRKVSG